MKFCTRLVLGSRQGIRLLRLFEAKILRGGFGIRAKRTERTERTDRNCAAPDLESGQSRERMKDEG
jgi:hypothetical protein